MMFSPGRRLLLVLLLIVVAEARRHDEQRYHRHRHRHELSTGSRWSALRKRVEPEQEPRSAGDEDDDGDFDSYEYEEYADEEAPEDQSEAVDDGGSRRAKQRRGRYEPRLHHPASSSRYRGRHYGHVGHRYRPYPHHRPHRVQGHPKRYGVEERPGHRRHSAGQNLVGGDSSSSGEDEFGHGENSYENDSYFRHSGRHGRPAQRKRPVAVDDAAESKGRRPSRRYKPQREDEEEKKVEEEDDYTYDEEDDDNDEDDNEEDAGSVEEDEEEEEESGRLRRRRKGREHQERFKSPARDRPASKLDEWMRLTGGAPNESRSSYHDSGKKRGSRRDEGYQEDDDEDDDDDDEKEEEEEEIELWKDDELDNGFYGEDEGDNSLKTFDDIIRRLTGGREPTSTTARTTVARRGYRSSPEIEGHLRRDAYGNLKLFEARGRVGDLDDTSAAGAVTSYAGSSKRKKSLGLEDRGDLAKWGGAEDERPQPDTSAGFIGNKSDEKKPSTTPSTTAATASTSTTTTSTAPPTTSTAASPTTAMTTTTSTTSWTTPRPTVSSRKENARSAYEPASTGSQYNGYQGKNDYPAMSAHSALKWQFLGTRDSVTETRNNMPQFSKSSKSAEMHAAHSHALRVAKEGSCQWPRAKVIPVRDVYPNSTATYIPHCAIVHRCSDDTGCCRSETLTCEAKQTHNVELYFYVTHIHGATAIEKLSFTNHTECECVERKDPRGSGGDGPMDRRPSRSHFYPSSTAPQNVFKPSPPKKPCRCTTQFTPKITNDGVCECGCVEHDVTCVRIQQGKGYLSVNDRLCIRSEKCTMPNCTFGEYMISQGKCPRKKDIFEAVTNRRPVFNQYHHRRS